MCRQNAQEYNMNSITQKSIASVYQNKKFTANCIKIFSRKKTCIFNYIDILLRGIPISCS